MPPSTDPPRTIKPLPRPYLLCYTLRVLAVIAQLVAAGTIVIIWTHQSLQEYPIEWKVIWTLQATLAGILSAAVFPWLSMMLYYSYQTALNIRAAERRQMAREVAAGSDRGASASDLAERMTLLLEEINENTLLNEQDKARKRARLADSRRERMQKEISQLIAATKWQMARTRIEELRTEQPDDEEVKELSRRLEAAMAEHREVDIMTSSEQIRSYMSLGLWEKARETAGQLAAKYPDHADARKMADVVRLEQEGFRKEERQRLYREIEHLVSRKHYRDARKVAETLIERYGNSPEAATLKGQMDELNRNADIETRREMETQIIEYEKQGRHKEAYEVARLLMEQYPESPQAIALQDKIDKLRELAGLS